MRTPQFPAVNRPRLYKLGRSILAIAVATSVLMVVGQPSLAAGKRDKTGPKPSRAHTKAPYVLDHILVAFKPGFVPRAANLQTYGLIPNPSVNSPYFALYNLTPAALEAGKTPESVIRDLRTEPYVRIAEPDYIYKAKQVGPNDPLFPQLWGLNNTGQMGGTAHADVSALSAWTMTTGKANLRVAVIDTGVDYHHQDLAANILTVNGKLIGYDFANHDIDPMDDHGHGTHVSGTIAAIGGNSLGVVGIAPTVKIMPVKFLDFQGYGTNAGAIQSIDFARTKGAQVMSNSWGGGGFSFLLLEAIQRAEAAKIAFVAAAGNDGASQDDEPEFPAGYNTFASNVIAVAATDRTDTLATFSNYGNRVDVAAPGVDVLSTLPNNDYGYASGTSMATPHVSGAVALLRSRFPDETVPQLYARLYAGADHPTSLIGFVRGGSRLNAANPLLKDTVAPSSPTAIKALSHSSSAIEYTFKASGDNGTNGAASRYDVRYSYMPITDDNFAMARAADVSIAPVVRGTVIRFVLTGLLPNQTVYTAIRAYDRVSNVSSTAFGTSATTLASVMYDDMEGLSNWRATGTWALTNKDANSGLKSWTDSPRGLYEPDSNSSITLKKPFIATGPMMLYFAAKLSVEPGYDQLAAEFSTDSGATWKQALGVSGFKNWAGYSAYLPVMAGDKVLLRFSLQSDESDEFDGVWLDDVRLSSAVQLSFDNVEDVNQFEGAKWFKTLEDAWSPRKSWTDSPGKNYGNNVDKTLTSIAPVDHSSVLPALVTFRCNVDLEEGYDFLYIEMSDGEAWRRVGSLTGFGFVWASPTYDITSLPISSKLRFHLKSDETNTKDGVHIDDISVYGEPSQLITP